MGELATLGGIDVLQHGEHGTVGAGRLLGVEMGGDLIPAVTAVLAAQRQVESRLAVALQPVQCLFKQGVILRTDHVAQHRGDAAVGQAGIDRTRVVWGKSVAVRVALGGARILKKKKKTKTSK